MEYRDEFDDPGRRGIMGRFAPELRVRPGTALSLLAGFAVLLGIGLWIAYPGDGGQSPQDVPIVRADAGDFRTAPQEPGGMEIPHRDSTVFTSLRSSRQAQEGGVENLLAEEEAEEPLPRSQLFAGLNTETAGEDVNNQPAPQSESKPADAPKTQTPVKTEEQTVSPAAIEPAAGPSAEPVKAAPAAQAASQGGTHYVQLAAIRDQSVAAAEWKKLQAKYGALSGYEYRVQKADLGAKGVFYRIQAGPVAKDRAVSTCESIKAVTPGGCLVVQ